MKTFGKIIIGFLVVIFIFLAFLPTILSSSWGVNLAENFINERIPGKVSIKDLHLSWFGSQKIDAVELVDISGSPVLNAEQIYIDKSLLGFIFNPKHFSTGGVLGLKAEITGDAEGATNIESALGLKNQAIPSTPVFLDNVNAEIKKSGHDDYILKAVGLTRQNEIKGQFSLDAQIGSDAKLKLHAQSFPILVLDQILAFKNKKLAGVLQNFLGDSLNISIDDVSNQDNHNLQIYAESPFAKATMKGQLQEDWLALESGSVIEWKIPPAQFAQGLKSLDLSNLPTPQKNLSGKITLDNFKMPLNDKSRDCLLKGVASLDPNLWSFPNETQAIPLNQFQVVFDTQPLEDAITFTIDGSGTRNNEPFSMHFNVKVNKSSLISQDFESLFQKGIILDGDLKGELSQTGQTTNTAYLKIAGIVRERDSKLNCEFFSDQVKFPELICKIEKIPFRELLDKGHFDSDIEGVISLSHPKIHSLSETEIESIVLPWKIDPEGNLLTISFKSSLVAGTAGDNLLGTLRIQNWKSKSGIDLSKSSLQLNVKLKGFTSQTLVPFFPNNQLSDVIGETFDADVVAVKDSQGNINGSVSLQNPKNSDVFLKKFSGEFALQENNRDVTFKTSTQQKLGSTQIQGTLLNLFNTQGSLALDKATISLEGNLNKFPIGLITRAVTGDAKLANQMEAVFGTQVDVNITAEIQDRNGPFKLDLRGLNGELFIDGQVKDSILFLNQPLVAKLKVTPQLEQVFLRETIPFLGSAVSSDKPIELTIAKDQFRLPLSSPNLTSLTIGSGNLDLHKMQFSREGPLGKVVSLLGIKSNRFEVWFTPVYFALQNGELTVWRTDMLIANAYPLASWGRADLNTNKLNFIVGLTNAALKNALSVKGLSENYMLQIPIRGTFSKPQVDTAMATTKISALVAQSQTGTPGKIIGTVVDTATSFTEQEVPEPTTKPLPWENMLKETASEKNDTLPEQVLDIPIDELKKGAKSIIKGIFGK